MAPTLTKLICLVLGAALGTLIGIGVGSDVRRWLRDRRANRVEQSRENMREAFRFLRGDGQ